MGPVKGRNPQGLQSRRTVKHLCAEVLNYRLRLSSLGRPRASRNLAWSREHRRRAELSTPLLGSGCRAWFMDGQKGNTVCASWLSSTKPSGPKETHAPSRDEWCETVKANMARSASVDVKHSIEKQSYKESLIV